MNGTFEPTEKDVLRMLRRLDIAEEHDQQGVRVWDKELPMVRAMVMLGLVKLNKGLGTPHSAGWYITRP